MSLPPLPPIQSAALRKQAFTDISVYRLSANPSAPELDRVENTDNNRLSFLGRAAIDSTLVSAPPNLDDQLAALARSYDLVKLLHVAWRGETSPALAQAEATRLMEAYIGALVLESEPAALEFIRALFHLAPKPPTVQSEPLPPPPATGQLHDLATRCGIQLEWDDRAEGAKHAQDWVSDITLKDKKTGRAWPCVARGVGKTKKLARADAAIKVLMMWDQMGFSS